MKAIIQQPRFINPKNIILLVFLISITLKASNIYEIIPISSTWPEAKTDAERRGGHLATITSQSEWDYIRSILGGDLDGKIVWIGATDARIEGTFEWVTGALGGIFKLASGRAKWCRRRRGQ